MYYPTVIDSGNVRGSISSFLGYNHNLIPAAGEMYDMKNLTSDLFPVMSPRKKRDLLLKIANTQWDNVPMTVIETAEVQVSEAYAHYKAEDIAMNSVQTCRISFTVDTTVLVEYECKVYSVNADEEKTEILSIAGDESSIYREFTTPEDTVSIEWNLDAIADVSVFDAQDMDLYLTDRSLLKNNRNIRGIHLKDNKLAYMIGNCLYFNNVKYDMTSYMPDPTDDMSRQQIISYGAYILVFPLGLYLNTKNPADRGYLGAKWTGKNVAMTYSLCNRDGSAITATVSSDAPDTPAAGDYWLCTQSDAPGLYMWSSSTSSWEAVLTTYISITATDADFSAFKKGDAVFMNTKLENVNNGSIIQAVGTDYIVVTGIMNVATDTETIDFTMERVIPKLDYVCVSNNRVWGCFAGSIDGSTAVNEIYASALGDAKNWNTFEGTAADSYRLSMGSDGDFTGACTYQGYPMFFKENEIYRIYGTYPAAYQLHSFNCRGVQKGSERSLAVCGEYLLYKSIQDVCVFDGNSAVGISEPLGKELFYDAAAGSCMSKYYISMRNAKGEYGLYVYDMKKNLWMKEDNLDIAEFSYNNSGQLYGRRELELYGFGEAYEDVGLTSVPAEEFVSWFGELGPFGYEGANKKYPKRLSLRAMIPAKDEIKVSVSYDDAPYKTLLTIRGTGQIESTLLTLSTQRCDHYRLRLEGHGDVRIYSLTAEYGEGSMK